MGVASRAGGGVGGEGMRGQGTDHVISEPMRGLRKKGRGGENIQTDIAPTRLTRPRGPSQ